MVGVPRPHSPQRQQLTRESGCAQHLDPITRRGDRQQGEALGVGGEGGGGLEHVPPLRDRTVGGCPGGGREGG